MEKNKTTGKNVFLIMALSLLLLSCAPHNAGNAHEEPGKTVPETQQTDNPETEAGFKGPDEGASGEETQTDMENEISVIPDEIASGGQKKGEDISDSFVNNSSEEISDSDQSHSDKKTDYAGSDDEGEIVIPSN